MDQSKIILATAAGLIIIAGVYFYTTRFRNQADETLTTPTPQIQEEETKPEDTMMPEENGLVEEKSMNETEQETMTDDAFDQTELEEETVEAVEISYTDTGFVPAAATVSAGDTVVFTNNSLSEMQLGAVSGSEGGLLSDFQQDEAGDTYQHTFTEVGTWPYQNVLQPQHQGIITVRE